MGVCGVVRVRAVWVELPLHAAWHLGQPVRLRVVEEKRKLGVVHLPRRRDSSFGPERCCDLLHKEYIYIARTQQRTGPALISAGIVT